MFQASGKFTKTRFAVESSWIAQLRLQRSIPAVEILILTTDERDKENWEVPTDQRTKHKHVDNIKHTYTSMQH
jgi:hypothetical protein